MQSSIYFKTDILDKFEFLSPVSFASIFNIAKGFADHIESNSEEISNILLEYETYEVVMDELSRTLDLLRNLNENEKFFTNRVGSVASFLPKNQPLYALSCFVIIPSFTAKEVHFRIPQSMRHFFSKLLHALDFSTFFPNVFVSDKERLKFLEERTALVVDTSSKKTTPVTDVVIFTGTSRHAEQLRIAFDTRTLFIANGSGHNPVVVASDANIENAVDAALALQFYNQGQDCAAPNTILVHKNILDKFLSKLRNKLKKTKVGPYSNKECRIGPISDAKDLIRIQDLLIENIHWIDPSTSGILRTAESIVEPTIIVKPLREGGNYTEVFAPVIFVQEFVNEKELSTYFENPKYARNAMYVTVYGSSDYVENLSDKKVDGKIIHQSDTILQNKHLHEKGVERGTQPYGGYGYSASSLSINGHIYPRPTLPQRDIYEWLVVPYKQTNKGKMKQELLSGPTKIVTKDVKKILGLKVKNYEASSASGSRIYIDLSQIKQEKGRFFEVDICDAFQLLQEPNARYIGDLAPEEIRKIQKLRQYIKANKELDLDQLKLFLFNLPKEDQAAQNENRTNQQIFFGHLYHLLFGKAKGPRLAEFLIDSDKNHICKLIDI